MRAATGAAIGGGQAAISGGDEQQIISGAVTGGANAMAFGERGQPNTKLSTQANAQDLSDQFIKTNAA